MAQTTVTFHSRYTEHNLTRQPRIDSPLAAGGWTVGPAIRYPFKPTKSPDGEYLIGELVVKVGQDKLQDHSGWLRDTEDTGVVRDAPDALRAHYQFGADFWEAPTPAAVFRKNLQRAGVKLDEEMVLSLISEEQRTAKRRELLDEAAVTLDAIREELANARAAGEAEQAKAKPAPKQKASA